MTPPTLRPLSRVRVLRVAPMLGCSAVAVNATGTVVREVRGGGAWVELDARAEPAAHPFAAHDARGRWVMAWREDCETVAENERTVAENERTEAKV